MAAPLPSRPAVAPAAAPALFPQTSCLQYLDARGTPLLDASAPFVARALRISSSLAVLHLENASLSGRPLMLLGESRAPAHNHPNDPSASVPDGPMAPVSLMTPTPITLMILTAPQPQWP